MEGLSASMYKGLRGYWRRKRGGYAKLSRSGSRRRPVPTRRKRVWRLRVARPRLGFLRRAAASPRKLLVWLRDAYVNLMLGFASSRVCSAGYGVAGDGVSAFGRSGPTKEYDDKMIVEIYRSILLAQGHTLHRDAPNPSTLTRR